MYWIFSICLMQFPSLFPTLLLPNRVSCNSASGWVQPMGVFGQKIKRKEQGWGVIPQCSSLKVTCIWLCSSKESHWLSQRSMPYTLILLAVKNLSISHSFQPKHDNTFTVPSYGFCYPCGSPISHSQI